MFGFLVGYPLLFSGTPERKLQIQSPTDGIFHSGVPHYLKPVLDTINENSMTGANVSWNPRYRQNIERKVSEMAQVCTVRYWSRVEHIISVIYHGLLSNTNAAVT